jgi:hypothetical protein
VEAAKSLLAAVRSRGDEELQYACSIDLARLEFDQGNYSQVVCILEVFYENGIPVDPRESQELFGRILYAIALAMIGRRERAGGQLSRIMYLAQMSGVEEACRLANTLKTCI